MLFACLAIKHLRGVENEVENWFWIFFIPKGCVARSRLPLRVTAVSCTMLCVSDSPAGTAAVCCHLLPPPI